MDLFIYGRIFDHENLKPIKSVKNQKQLFTTNNQIKREKESEPSKNKKLLLKKTTESFGSINTRASCVQMDAGSNGTELDNDSSKLANQE